MKSFVHFADKYWWAFTAIIMLAITATIILVPKEDKEEIEDVIKETAEVFVNIWQLSISAEELAGRAVLLDYNEFQNELTKESPDIVKSEHILGADWWQAREIFLRYLMVTLPGGSILVNKNLVETRFLSSKKTTTTLNLRKFLGPIMFHEFEHSLTDECIAKKWPYDFKWPFESSFKEGGIIYCKLLGTMGFTSVWDCEGKIFQRGALEEAAAEAVAIYTENKLTPKMKHRFSREVAIPRYLKSALELIEFNKKEGISPEEFQKFHASGDLAGYVKRISDGERKV